MAADIFAPATPAAHAEVRPGNVRLAPRVHWFPGNFPAAGPNPCPGMELAELDGSEPAEANDVDPIPPADQQWGADASAALQAREELLAYVEAATHRDFDLEADEALARERLEAGLWA